MITNADLSDRRAYASMASWRSALTVLAAEIPVIEVVAADLIEGRTLSQADEQRLALAVQRISRCRAVLVPSAYRPPREVAA